MLLIRFQKQALRPFFRGISISPSTTLRSLPEFQLVDKKLREGHQNLDGAQRMYQMIAKHVSPDGSRFEVPKIENKTLKKDGESVSILLAMAHFYQNDFGTAKELLSLVGTTSAEETRGGVEILENLLDPEGINFDEKVSDYLAHIFDEETFLLVNELADKMEEEWKEDMDRRKVLILSHAHCAVAEALSQLPVVVEEDRFESLHSKSITKALQKAESLADYGECKACQQQTELIVRALIQRALIFAKPGRLQNAMMAEGFLKAAIEKCEGEILKTNSEMEKSFLDEHVPVVDVHLRVLYYEASVALSALFEAWEKREKEGEYILKNARKRLGNVFDMCEQRGDLLRKVRLWTPRPVLD